MTEQMGNISIDREVIESILRIEGTKIEFAENGIVVWSGECVDFAKSFNKIVFKVDEEEVVFVKTV